MTPSACPSAVLLLPAAARAHPVRVRLGPPSIVVVADNSELVPEELHRDQHRSHSGRRRA
eukprot:CAMPEP_0182535520 /NCGR_PEP_ID=MMETSP1323-20130603/18086_1 /TAXON_ID=236787 /ORGANISM="Florenciella parvula, Strain RCC1693" /LENGTH=59 /DNA_ID=CAMNT_0024745663 /DNA_START=33 /DNA_END=208 /DNA_ORIENTATION=+